MSEIGILNRSPSLSPRDFAFLVEAWRRQQIDFCHDWSLPLLPIVGYAQLPAAESVMPVDLSAAVYPHVLMDDIGEPGDLGYHTDIGGLIYARSRVDENLSVTGSHENMELTADPTADKWIRMPDGRDVALEVGDPVQNDSYPIDVTMMDLSDLRGISTNWAPLPPDKLEKRSVLVSNYVLPSWFQTGSTGPWDRMGLLHGPFENRGYLIVRDRAGNVSNEFASIVTDTYRAKVAARIGVAHSRTARRHA